MRTGETDDEELALDATTTSPLSGVLPTFAMAIDDASPLVPIGNGPGQYQAAELARLSTTLDAT